jgi:hypothetical protein
MLFMHLIRTFIPAGAVLASITKAAVGSSEPPVGSGDLFRLHMPPLLLGSWRGKPMLSAEQIEDVVVPTANQTRAYW